ncbi:MAG: monosaccharide transporter substrate-binding protein family [Herbinix sp.]|jgi:ribose transport system substrate-binding protein|nr:monosaccharide transporter substrate-binding protein family [Herbinix sp.]
MRNNLKIIFAIALITVLMGVLVVSSYYYVTDTNQKDDLTKISVIVYGTGNSDRWSTMKQGLDQGALDFDAEINFVITTEEKGATEQSELIERELANGAEGIILAAADSNKLSAIVHDQASSIPIVLVETSIKNTERLTYISADNYSMGLNIGRSVYLSSEENKTVAVFVDNLQRNSVSERYDGLMDSLQYTEYAIKPWEMSEEDTDPAVFLQTKLKEDPADVIIALDDNSLEVVIDAVGAVESDIDIYGIGSTNKIVHYLDYGLIDSIVFQNEFNMGYLSVQEIMNDINREVKEPDIDIEFRTVNKATMYLPKNQRLVFPIVQ